MWFWSPTVVHNDPNGTVSWIYCGLATNQEESCVPFKLLQLFFSKFPSWNVKYHILFIPAGKAPLPLHSLAENHEIFIENFVDYGSCYFSGYSFTLCWCCVVL